MLANGQMIASLLLWLATVVAGAPDATRTSPVPEWAARFDEFMGLLDARGVTFIEGGRDALYLEAGRRWLCIWRETSGLRCYAWPGNAPRIRSFGIFSHDDQTRLPTETDDHLFDPRVDAPGGEDAASGSSCYIVCYTSRRKSEQTRDVTLWRRRVLPQSLSPKNLNRDGTLARTYRISWQRAVPRVPHSPF
jgi:hypothetical protein